MRVAQRHFLERGKGRIAHRLALVGATGVVVQPVEFERRIVRDLGCRCAGKAQLLAVDDVVAVAAPGIEHQHAARVAGRTAAPPLAKLFDPTSMVWVACAIRFSRPASSSQPSGMRPASILRASGRRWPWPNRPRRARPRPDGCRRRRGRGSAVSSSRLCGRNQALCVRIGSSEKAEPTCALSSSRKSSGVKMRLVTRSAAQARHVALFEVVEDAVAVARPFDVPVDVGALPRCGTGDST